MADYSVGFAWSARKELEKLPLSAADRIVDRVESLTAIPRPSGAVKIKGNKGLWRIRIGEYRVIYRIDDAARAIDISAVRNRKEAYSDI